MKQHYLYLLFLTVAAVTGVAVNFAFSVNNENSLNRFAGLQLFEASHALLSQSEDTTPEVDSVQIKVSDDDKKMLIVESQEKQLNSQSKLNEEQGKLIASLRQENEQLQQQIALLESTVEKQAVYIKDHERSLHSAQEKMRLLASNSEQTKETINKLPDMMRLKVKPEKPSVNLSAPVQIEEEKKPESALSLAKVSGAVEFGFKYEQNNATTKHLEGSLSLDYEEPDKYMLENELDFEFENEDDENNTEKYRWQLQGDYNLDPNDLLFLRSDISRSKYASYSKEDVYTLGYGRVVFNDNKHKLNIEVGPGYRFVSPNLDEDEDAISIDELILRTRFNYQRIISENLQFKMDTAFEIGAENSIYETTLKAQHRIYQSLFLVFDFDYQYTKLVPVDTAKDEITSGMKLLYAF